MDTITDNEMKALLLIFKDMSNRYNANSISIKLGLSAMGALKILKNLERKKILKSEQLGKAVFYSIDFENEYANEYLNFLLKTEAEQTIPRIKRWFKELKKLEDYAEIGVLFGSVIIKETYNDIDLLLVLKESESKQAEKTISELNSLNIKQIHAVKQTKKDLEENLKKKDKIILSALKNGVILFGQKKLIEVVKNAAK